MNSKGIASYSMKCLWGILITSLLFASCKNNNSAEPQLSSPDGQLVIEFNIIDSKPAYSVEYKGTKILEPSFLGFEFEGLYPMKENFRLINIQHSSFDEEWEPVWGSYSKIRNHYREMQVELQETSELARKLFIVFRAYNDGLGFRYFIPEQKELTGFSITRELTEFNFPSDFTTWWHIANYDSYEYTHVKTPLSELGDEKHIAESEYGWPAFGDAVPGAANTPVTMETPEGVYLSIHEADLTDYAGLTLRKRLDKAHALAADLVPWPDGNIKVKANTPLNTPWRTIQVADSPGGLIESNLILNLNDPCALDNTDWIKPGKYVGIWWALHIGKWTWGAGPDHGATTQNTRDYIDFASENGIPYVLVEGWNKQGVCGAEAGEPDFINAADDFDLHEIIRYGKEKGVGFLAYNETGCEVSGYMRDFDTIFSYYQSLGIPGIKAGHVGNRLQEIYHHHSQWGVNYYHLLTEKAAKYEIGLIIHEPIKSTGLERTYPNLLTKEGVAGMEQDKFINADPREHTVEVPFTRMLAGPMDYMPGIFDPEIKGFDDMKVQSTVAKQLAMYPVYLSGLQSVTDLIENYKGRPEFQFIRDVPVSWDDTKVLNGVIGDYITMARRKGDEWYIGAMTDEESRSFPLPLNFLGKGKYLATIYSDGLDADAISNPTSVTISETEVDNSTVLEIWMAPGGGQAIRIKPIEADD